MSELLIAAAPPPVAPPGPAPSRPNANANAAPASETAAPAAKAGEPRGVERQPTAESRNQAAETSNGNGQASFATVLKKQMQQAARPGQIKDPLLAEAADPRAALVAAIAGDKPLDANALLAAQGEVVKLSLQDGVPGADKEKTTTTEAGTSDLLPFIEQLLPQLAHKAAAQAQKEETGGQKGDEARVATPLDGGVLIALPATASPQATEALKNAGSERHEQTRGPAPTLTLPGNASDPGTAISADKALSDAALPGLDAANGEFAELIATARDHLTTTQASGQPGVAGSARVENAATTAPLRMENPVGHSDWSNELGNKLSWMVTAQRQQADLVLNPPQLGRVEISLTVSGDQASAVFVSPNAEVRELLEGSLPRLREILSGAGINLGQTHVGSESPSQFAGQDAKGDANSTQRGNAAGSGNDIATVAAPAPRAILAGRGMVDVFA